MAQCYGCTASTTRTWARGHDGLHRNEVMRRHYGTVAEMAIQHGLDLTDYTGQGRDGTMWRDVLAQYEGPAGPTAAFWDTHRG